MKPLWAVLTWCESQILSLGMWFIKKNCQVTTKKWTNSSHQLLFRIWQFWVSMSLWKLGSCQCFATPEVSASFGDHETIDISFDVGSLAEKILKDLIWDIQWDPYLCIKSGQVSQEDRFLGKAEDSATFCMLLLFLISSAKILLSRLVLKLLQPSLLRHMLWVTKNVTCSLRGSTINWQ